MKFISAGADTAEADAGGNAMAGGSRRKIRFPPHIKTKNTI
jgi:hypothetical protein